MPPQRDRGHDPGGLPPGRPRRSHRQCPRSIRQGGVEELPEEAWREALLSEEPWPEQVLPRVPERWEPPRGEGPSEEEPPSGGAIRMRRSAAPGPKAPAVFSQADLPPFPVFRRRVLRHHPHEDVGQLRGELGPP